MGRNNIRLPRTNPIVSSSQYGLMQAVASGVAKVKGISKQVAEKLIQETPASIRSQFAREVAATRNPEKMLYAIEVWSFEEHRYRTIRTSIDTLSKAKYLRNQYPRHLQLE